MAAAKKCVKCDEMKSLDEFYAHKSGTRMHDNPDVAIALAAYLLRSADVLAML